jgi:hypothetical protein
MRLCLEGHPVTVLDMPLSTYLGAAVNLVRVRTVCSVLIASVILQRLFRRSQSPSFMFVRLFFPNKNAISPPHIEMGYPLDCFPRGCRRGIDAELPVVDVNGSNLLDNFLIARGGLRLSLFRFSAIRVIHVAPNDQRLALFAPMGG